MHHYFSLCLLNVVGGLEVNRLDLRREFGVNAFSPEKVTPIATETETLSKNEQSTSVSIDNTDHFPHDAAHGVAEEVEALRTVGETMGELMNQIGQNRSKSSSNSRDGSVAMSWRPEGCGPSPSDVEVNDAIISLNEHASTMKCEGWAKYSTDIECQNANFRAINNCSGIAFTTSQPSFLMSHILLTIPKDNSAKVDLKSIEKCTAAMELKRIDGATGCYIQCTESPGPDTFEDVALTVTEDELLIYANYTFTKAHPLAPAAYFLKPTNASLCESGLSYKISGHAFARKGSPSSAMTNRIFHFGLVVLALCIV